MAFTKLDFNTGALLDPARGAQRAMNNIGDLLKNYTDVQASKRDDRLRREALAQREKLAMMPYEREDADRALQASVMKNASKNEVASIFGKDTADEYNKLTSGMTEQDIATVSADPMATIKGREGQVTELKNFWNRASAGATGETARFNPLSGRIEEVGTYQKGTSKDDKGREKELNAIAQLSAQDNVVNAKAYGRRVLDDAINARLGVDTATKMSAAAVAMNAPTGVDSKGSSKFMDQQLGVAKTMFKAEMAEATEKNRVTNAIRKSSSSNGSSEVKDANSLMKVLENEYPNSPYFFGVGGKELRTLSADIIADGTYTPRQLELAIRVEATGKNDSWKNFDKSVVKDELLTRLADISSKPAKYGKGSSKYTTAQFSADTKDIKARYTAANQGILAQYNSGTNNQVSEEALARGAFNKIFRDGSDASGKQVRGNGNKEKGGVTIPDPVNALDAAWQGGKGETKKLFDKDKDKEAFRTQLNELDPAKRDSVASWMGKQEEGMFGTGSTKGVEGNKNTPPETLPKTSGNIVDKLYSEDRNVNSLGAMLQKGLNYTGFDDKPVAVLSKTKRKIITAMNKEGVRSLDEYTARIAKSKTDNERKGLEAVYDELATQRSPEYRALKADKEVSNALGAVTSTLTLATLIASGVGIATLRTLVKDKKGLTKMVKEAEALKAKNLSANEAKIAHRKFVETYRSTGKFPQ